MLRTWIGTLATVGCLCLFEGEGAGGGAGAGSAGASGAAGEGGQGAAGAGSAGGEQNVEGLKSALEKERTARKDLQKQLRETQDALSKIQTDGGSIEDLKTKLGAAESRLKIFETKEQKGSALDQAIQKATTDGLVVDVEKARKYVERLDGKPEDLAKEAVELFGTKKGPPAKGDAGQGDGAGQDRAFKGQPGQQQPAGANVATADLGKLFRENPEAYKAEMAKQRSEIPFFGGT